MWRSNHLKAIIALLALLAAGFALLTWQSSGAEAAAAGAAHLLPVSASGATATSAPIFIPTSIPLSCSYTVVEATGTIVPGTSDTGNHCDDCVTDVFFPFPVNIYGQEFSQALASSNGNLQFISANPISFNECLPGPGIEYALMPHWDDLLTDANPGCPGDPGGCGVFSGVIGVAPNRIFTLEWRAVRYTDPFERVNFQVWFYEGQSRFDFVYGEVSNNGSDSTVGVQKDGTAYTQFSCMQASLSPGLVLQWNAQGCPIASPTATGTPCPGCTPTWTPTITQTPTAIPSATATACGTERFTGAITTNDPQQTGRLTRDEVRSLCDAPKVCPGIEDTALRHYDSYTRTNNSNSAQCVTVGISTLCQGTQFLFAAAYLDTFDPSNLCANYLADIGASPYPHAFMSFEVPAGHSVVLVVSEVTTNQGCPEYTVTINGLGSCTAGSPTPTVTGTPPTVTSTPSSTPGSSCSYSFSTATATIVPGTEDSGNHCDDCVTGIALPFTFPLYGVDYSAANVSSNGNIQFVTTSNSRFNTCLPAAPLSTSLLPDWTDLVTDCSQCGIYTSVTGTAPDRAFNIEWRAGYFKGGLANFEVRLHESTGIFDFVYGQMDDPGNNSTVGVQSPGAVLYTQYSCNGGGLSNGLLVRGIPQSCVGPTASPVVTGTPPATVTAGTATPTATLCAVSFTDVPPGSTFYPFIRCLACRGIINGYPCGGPGEPCNSNNDPYFRPGSNVTRGQFAKIAANSAGFNEPTGAQQYEDVPVGSTFFDFIWRLTNRGLVNGYPCGGPGEPCGPNNLPYFRPNANVTRGQLSKIDANAAGFNDTPGAQQYEDVLPGSTFYDFIWRLSDRGIINGYPCGGTGEPCGPNNLPYFRPGASATRGQASKIVANTFFPSCQTPADR